MEIIFGFNVKLVYFTLGKILKKRKKLSMTCCAVVKKKAKYKN